METTMTKAMAMSAVRTDATRPRRGANTAHAVAARSVQGWTVPFAGFGLDVQLTDVRTAGVDAIAPTTGVVYPRLEAPPV
jgi:hypothetical protein